MLTDNPPRRSLKAFAESDQRHLIPLPSDRRLVTNAESIEFAMKGGTTADVQRACAAFLRTASEFYRVPECGVQVLAARPLRVREYSTTELFGDYHPSTMAIRVWKKATDEERRGSSASLRRFARSQPAQNRRAMLFLL